MISERPAWDCTGGMDDLVIQIATESPNIPETMSKIGKDFLRRCFAWDPTERWTAEMLLRHPFLLETEAPPPSITTALGFSVSKKCLHLLLLGLDQFQGDRHCPKLCLLLHLGLNRFRGNQRFEKICLLLLGFLPEESLHDFDQYLSQVWVGLIEAH
jgi:serine/threonine protein kinase